MHVKLSRFLLSVLSAVFNQQSKAHKLPSLPLCFAMIDRAWSYPPLLSSCQHQRHLVKKWGETSEKSKTEQQRWSKKCTRKAGQREAEVKEVTKSKCGSFPKFQVGQSSGSFMKQLPWNSILLRRIEGGTLLLLFVCVTQSKHACLPLFIRFYEDTKSICNPEWLLFVLIGQVWVCP